MNQLIQFKNFVQVIFFGLCLILMTCAANAQSNNQTPTLNGALNDDGSLKKGFAGSFNPQGFQMTTDADGKPRFIAEQMDKTNLAPQTGDCADSWDDRFYKQGFNSQIYALAVDGNGNVYVGGAFNIVGNVFANGIAKWDGAKWLPLKGGIDAVGLNTNMIRAIKIVGNDVYVGGTFSSVDGVAASNIARWDGKNWSALGSGVSGGVEVIESDNGDLYVGGGFATAGGFSAKNIAKWNGNEWSVFVNSANGVSGTNNLVRAIAVSGGEIYVGGQFTQAGGVPASVIAKYSNDTWSALGSGLSQSGTNTLLVNSIVINSDVVYVSGSFTKAGSVTVGNIAQWSNGTWSAVGNTLSGSATLKFSPNGELYAVGGFNGAGSPANYIARWNGSSWVGLSQSTNSFVSRIDFRGGNLYVMGGFTQAGGIAATNVARWNGNNWFALDQDSGQGLNQPIRAMVKAANGDLYVGGEFTKAGDILANRVVRWNGTNWTALGSGVNGIVRAVAITDNGDLYVGGTFTNAGGVAASNIAKWDGTSWSALSSGVSGTVWGISAIGNDVYVAGDFRTAGGAAAMNVAKWSNNSWSPLGAGVGTSNTWALSLAVHGSDVYVGGLFRVAGSVSANGIAKWNGSSWSGLGSGINITFPTVYAIAVANNGDVYAGGFFSEAAGAPGNNIAKWDGNSWSALGSGMNDDVYALTIDGNDLYAGGKFVSAGGIPANHFAKWDSNGWSEPGGGTVYYPFALIADADVLYVGGGLNTVGCRVSFNFALYFTKQWTNSAGTNDWHDAANWNVNAVPSDGATVNISASDVSINSADVHLQDLRVENNRTLTVGADRTLTVDGNLNLNGGYIEGAGSVVVTNCNPLAISGVLSDGSAGYIKTNLVRCVNNSGGFEFPVGTANGYAPVTLSNITGTGSFSVTPNQGAYTNTATNLPVTRLARWWNLTNLGITKTDVTFKYLAGDITAGNVNNYRVYKIENETATLMGGTLDTAHKTITVANISEFSDWTLAEPFSPTAANVSVAGRVLTAKGRPIGNARITLTDSAGSQRTAVANPFGYYSFYGVPSGETYILSVSSKRYTFADSPRIVSVFEDINDADFVGNSFGIEF